ncbi:unnamed protein product [Nesidiocoris tenuis]|uniref:Uncharacterized protein n=1 Tax=Nesidiocoris tenuis TaxID=355587 RepID=A0A6H5GSQ7_9HEMI|nr:unnamed protein product [Nesidiocoris tenuis]
MEVKQSVTTRKWQCALLSSMYDVLAATGSPVLSHCYPDVRPPFSMYISYFYTHCPHLDSGRSGSSDPK